MPRTQCIGSGDRPTKLTTSGGTMQFGVCLHSKIDDIGLVTHAENLGYDAAWFADSQLLWSDAYACLALANGVTAWRLMGRKPARLSEFEAFLDTTRRMLRGEDAPFTYKGETTDV